MTKIVIMLPSDDKPGNKAIFCKSITGNNGTFSRWQNWW